MVEGTRLESVQRGNSFGGSNPPLSAISPAFAAGDFCLTGRRIPRGRGYGGQEGANPPASLSSAGLRGPLTAQAVSYAGAAYPLHGSNPCSR